MTILLSPQDSGKIMQHLLGNSVLLTLLLLVQGGR